MRVSLKVVSGIGQSGIEPGKNQIRTGSRGINRLTDAACRAFKPGAGKKSDGLGLYLLVKPNGSKLWQWPYTHAGKPNVCSFGVYPQVSIGEARAERDKAREWLRVGLDPNVEKKAERARVGQRQGDVFSKLAADWLAVQSSKWSKDHADARRRLIDNDLIPALGALPLADLEASPATALAALKRIDGRGAHETASKARITGSMICRYGIITGRMKHDPFEHLGAALKRPPVKHRATIPLDEMPQLFKALAAVPAEASTKLAVAWLILTVCRTVEMRLATWSEIERGKLWRVPGERMKMREGHAIPLSKQALRVLELARPLRQSDDGAALIFPGFTKAGHLSENAILALLARAGYYGRQTGHGFRASFSTWANEVKEADPDVVEACLAHRRGDIRSVYNRASYLSRRLALLQAWADQCTAWGLRLP